MKNLSFKIIVVVAAIIAAIIAMKVTQTVYKTKLDEAYSQVRVETIKNSKLTKINKGLYTKLVADTLTIRELRRVVDSLNLKIKNPKIVTEVVFVPVNITKPVDGIVVKDSILYITDSYPNKISPFIKYSATYNLVNNKGISNFEFTPIKISLGIGQNKDGTYQINTKVPEFIEVLKVDVKALPMGQPKVDNFGILLGAGYGRDFRDNSDFIKLSTDVRIKKFYIGIEGTTNSTISTGIKFEF